MNKVIVFLLSIETRNKKNNKIKDRWSKKPKGLRSI